MKAVLPVIASNGIPYLEMRVENRKYAICFPWSYGLRPKKLLACVAVLPALVRIPSQRPLVPSVTSVSFF